MDFDPASNLANLRMAIRPNGKGDQVLRRSGGAETVFLHDEAGHWLGEYDSSGQQVQQVVWLDDLPVGLIVGPVAANQPLHYIEADALGTPRMVIDSSRDLLVWEWPLTGEAFGKDQPNEDPDGDGTPLIFHMRFPGQRYDAASGLNQNGFRDFDPGIGRYNEPDPLGQADGPSTFAYVASNPFTFIDPKGLFRVDCPGCDNRRESDIRSSVQTWCDERLIDRMIKDVALRRCIKNRCRKATVKCEECPKFKCGSGPNDPNAVITSARGHSTPSNPDQITLCTNAAPAGGGWGSTVIHEFAHTCKISSGDYWNHGMGIGVPNDYIPTPNQGKCYPVP